MPGDDSVSCLCVTHQRPHLLRRSIDCFLAQTHPGCELVILHEDGDAATAQLLAGLNAPGVRAITVPTAAGMRLGTKRNTLVAAARGRYVAIWDDDDWHAPGRIAAQWQAVLDTGRPACVLQHVVVYDAVNRRAFLSLGRHWEPTLFCERGAMPPYAPLNTGEDVPCVEALISAGRVFALSRPDLYVYVYHGGNTCNAAHFARNVFTRSTRLGDEMAARVAALLAAPGGAPLTLADVVAAHGAAA